MEERKTKKKKFNRSFWLYFGIAILFLIVLITSIVVNYQSKRLKDLQEANDKIPEIEIVKIL